MFKCKFCPAVYVKASGLEAHVNQCHSHISNGFSYQSGGMFRCCLKALEDCDEAGTLRGLEAGEKKVQCPSCKTWIVFGGKGYWKCVVGEESKE